MKVGFGDYYPPGPGGAEDYLRMAFLECVRVNCPAVLRELRENFLPTYEMMADDESTTAGEDARENGRRRYRFSRIYRESALSPDD